MVTKSANFVASKTSALIKNCVLAGDMELLENDASIYTGVLDILANLLSASKAVLKKV